MMNQTLRSGAAAALAALLLASSTGAAKLSDYTVANLLEPCVEGDNDSRWGAAAEAECEQYIKGFTDAFVMTMDGGKAAGVCLPDQNRADEIRWAFMRWGLQHYDQRGMPAAEGLLTTIKASFKCQ